MYFRAFTIGIAAFKIFSCSSSFAAENIRASSKLCEILSSNPYSVYTPTTSWSAHLYESFRKAYLGAPVILDSELVAKENAPFYSVIKDAYLDGNEVVTIGDLWSYRVRKNRKLRPLFEAAGFFSNGQITLPESPEEAVRHFQFLGELIRQSLIPYKERGYVLPSFVSVNKAYEKSSYFIYPWAIQDDVGEYRKMTSQNFGIVDFDTWMELIYFLKILLVDSVQLPHEYGHILALVANPYEQSVKQYEFAKLYLNTLASLNDFGLKNTYRTRMVQAANVLFEDLTLPNLEVTKKFFGNSPVKFSRKFVDANDLFESKELDGQILKEVARFEKEILGSEEMFYAAIDEFGGGYFDVSSLLWNTPVIFSHYKSLGSLEKIFFVYRATSGEERRKHLLKLFTAFYNAYVGNVKFDQVFDDCVKNIGSDSRGVPRPLHDTLSMNYFKSYCGEQCAQQLDLLF